MICPACQTEAAPGARFCPACGATLPVAATRQDETRLVTILFADMSGSVATTHELDPEEALERVGVALEVMSGAVARYGGRIDRYLGDGVLALFGVPRANEDDPVRAVLAALDMRDEARARGFEITAGINTGDAYVGRVGSDVHRELTAMGPAVNLAARLQGRCDPGEVLVGESTWRIARRAFEFEARETRIKGLADPVPAWAARGRKPRPETARGLEGMRSALVGREEEIGALSDAVSRARAGAGQAVTVIGDAGVGKSRLIAEARRVAETPDGDGGCLWLEGRCFESGASTGYAPFVDLLRERFPSGPGSSVAARVDPVTAEIADLADEALPDARIDEVLVPILNLLSIPDPRALEFGDLPPQQVKARTYSAVLEYLRALARRRPVVLVLDDLHWADSLTIELVPRLVEGLAASRAVIVCVQRPVQEHGSRHLVGLIERHAPDRHREIRLRPLDEGETRRLVLSLLGGADLPVPALGPILEKAQGNPLFVEEVLRSLLSKKQIAIEAGAVTVLQNLRVDDVPTTVQSIIQSRVDRIDDEPRRALQSAAVIGRVFARGLLDAMIGSELDLDRALWQLEQHDLVYLDRVVPEEEYSFKHVFTRDTVYRSLLRKRRAALHLDAARAIESLYADRIEEHVERLAYHYDRTGDADSAAAYLFRAGEKSRRAHLNEEALATFRRALERVEELPDDARAVQLRARIRESIGDVVELGGSHDEAVTWYERALGDRSPGERLARGRLMRKAGASRQIQRRRDEALALFDRAVEELGEPPSEPDSEWDEERAAIELGRIMLEYFTSTPDLLVEQIERSGPIVESRGTALQRALLFNSRALLGLRRERYVASAATVEHARAGFDATRDVESRLEVADVRFVYAFSLLWAGRLDESEGRLRELLTEAERVGYATIQARCVAYLALIHRKRGDLAETRRWANRTLEVSAASGMAEYVAAAEAHLAWADLREGRIREAAERAQRAYDEGEKMGGAYRVLVWIVTWPLLGVRLERGDLDGAVALARALLAPEAQPAIEPVRSALAEAVARYDAGRRDPAVRALQEAAGQAREPGYL
jgi:class 3 adenylate cyclase